MTRNEYNMKRMTLPQLAAKYAELCTPNHSQPLPPPSPVPPPPAPNHSQPLTVSSGNTGKFGAAGEKPAEIPVLYFNHAGWCPALAASYFIGYFHSATWAEYRALKPYASQPPR